MFRSFLKVFNRNQGLNIFYFVLLYIDFLQCPLLDSIFPLYIYIIPSLFHSPINKYIVIPFCVVRIFVSNQLINHKNSPLHCFNFLCLLFENFIDDFFFHQEISQKKFLGLFSKDEKKRKREKEFYELTFLLSLEFSMRNTHSYKKTDCILIQNFQISIIVSNHKEISY